MKLNISRLTRTLILIFLTGFSISLFAQTMNDAGTKFNDANKMIKAKDYDKAITELEACIGICKQIGDAKATELKGKAEKQLVNAYYKKGISLYKSKNFNEAIKTFELTAKKGNELGQAGTAKKAKSLIPNVHNSIAAGLLKDGKLDEALKNVNIAIEKKPGFYQAYLTKALIQKDKGDLAGMQKSINLCVENAGAKAKAQETANKAKTLGSSAFTAAGVEAVKAQKFDKAIADFNNALGYEDNADTHYFLTTAYNGAQQWDKAIASSQKALAGMTEGKDKVYFEQGRAYEGKGDAAAACTAYKKVAAGPNAEAAKYQIEHVLKCK